jgi:DNA mismatch repair protein MutS2
MDLDSGSRILVLSGPNSGGKTVTLKSLALCNYFASLGMYVPAEECLLPFLKRILFILGDNQSIVDSLSTFAAHLKNWRRILNRADEAAALFVDEIMDATDPREGEVLACEILRYLGRSGCRAFISTHYNEVKRLALESSVFVNASMKFNEHRLEPEFILCSGIPGRSYGIELAEKFSLPRSVTAKARKTLGKAHFELNSLIEKQKSELLSMQELRQKEEALVKQLDILRNHLEELQEDFVRQRETYLEKAYKNVLKEHDSFRHRWEAAQKSRNSEPVTTTVSTEQPDCKEADSEESLFQAAWLNNQRKYAARLARHKKTDILQPGDTVMVLPYNKQARVLEVMAGRNELKVEMGSVTLILPDKEVEKCAGLSEPPRKVKSGVRIVPSKLSVELDLRGFDRDEALYELENHLDEAVSQGAPRILIICGKGVLRGAVLEFLRRNPLTVNRNFSFPNDGSVLVDLG